MAGVTENWPLGTEMTVLIDHSKEASTVAIEGVDSAEGITLRLSCLFLSLEYEEWILEWQDYRWEGCCMILTAKWPESGQHK